MELTFRLDEGLTVLAAWWGAIIATAVFLFEIFKWARSGPSLRVTTNPGMRPFNIPGMDAEQDICLVVVVNNGKAPTTLTHFIYIYYGNWWDRIRRKRDEEGVIVDPGGERTRPEPGMAASTCPQVGVLIGRAPHEILAVPRAELGRIEPEEESDRALATERHSAGRGPRVHDVSGSRWIRRATATCPARRAASRPAARLPRLVNR